MSKRRDKRQSDHFGVRQATIRAWCMGRIACGLYYPRKPNCWATRKLTGEKLLVDPQAEQGLAA